MAAPSAGFSWPLTWLAVAPLGAAAEGVLGAVSRFHHRSPFQGGIGSTAPISAKSTPRLIARWRGKVRRIETSETPRRLCLIINESGRPAAVGITPDGSCETVDQLPCRDDLLLVEPMPPAAVVATLRSSAAGTMHPTGPATSDRRSLALQAGPLGGGATPGREMHGSPLHGVDRIFHRTLPPGGADPPPMTIWSATTACSAWTVVRFAGALACRWARC